MATIRAPGRADALNEIAGSSEAIEVRQLDVTVPDSVTGCIEGVLADHGGIDPGRGSWDAQPGIGPDRDRDQHGPDRRSRRGDPYADLLSRYNATMAGLLGGGDSPEGVADVIAGIAGDWRPYLRDQSSPAATGIAARKLIDATGDSVLAPARPGDGAATRPTCELSRCT